MQKPSDEALAKIGCVLVTLAPLGLWKAIEIITYIFIHVRIVIT